MLSLIEVKCPHCGAQGQIVLPPLGAIIVGPCPECQGMVVVFCGRVLALDKEVMTDGTMEEKRAHLLQILSKFIEERVSRLLGENSADQEEERTTSSESSETDEVVTPGKLSLHGSQKAPVITTEEMKSFIDVDLKLIDNKDYFKAVFE